MNKTASERPLCDPGGSDGGGMCVCVCKSKFSCSVQYAF